LTLSNGADRKGLCDIAGREFFGKSALSRQKIDIFSRVRVLFGINDIRLSLND
jgi:hypothetical protein